ncbi:P-loop containing nucleoside triphosphate hydrolase protein [Lasiosphaeria miniovina]|uniref:P-loop containing nucleoside triphosphate hydrolase protein n=1 Tax=Lasiosphaeria miniovina TaxID=1954250 RepID=A0AA40AU96_9PEZI|nr:P-loop containing nucleoside triphosphate hydrolase protein [Lasiosphaeria miniovina]KAK0722131.1 P-loop containing nucleoside triphosphate hydrolase protein [Lasiosphaeria miniovina]
MSDQKRVKDLVSGLVIAAGTVSAYFLFRDLVGPYLAKLIDPEREKHEEARRKAQANLQRIRRSRKVEAGDDDDGTDGSRHTVKIEDLVLNEYENRVAMEVVAPEDIPVGFDAIGGLEDIIEELKEAIIYPLTMPHLYAHGGPLLAAPSGVLLYGPPGCGKTMLAKAVAHESGASFINLHISTLTEKWYGDSNKLVRAVFSLAHKLQPAIVFIDEIDAVLGTRRSEEHEASGMVKAEFMTLWDGLTSTNAAGIPSRIVVLGATNRINDIDEAILRRMPKKFPVNLPGKEQRRRILQLVLGDTRRDPEHFDIDYIAKVTAGMSGSDIKEACRDAAMMPMREHMRELRASGGSLSRVNPTHIRGIRTEDFFGRRGGGRVLAEARLRHSSTTNGQSKSSSSDVFEDVDDDLVPEPVE